MLTTVDPRPSPPRRTGASVLHLIGVVHLDPAGYDRLRAALTALAPALVTVEVSPFALAFRATRGPALRAALEGHRRPDGALPPGLEAVWAQLADPFEHRAAVDVGARVIPVGDSALSRAHLARFEAELMGPANLARLAATDAPPLAAQVATAWRRARQRLGAPPLLGTADAERLARIEDTLSARIRDAVATLPPAAACAHVGGWEHLHGLHARLADLAPAVRLLDPGP